MVSLAQLSLPDANVGCAPSAVSTKKQPGSKVATDLLRAAASPLGRVAFACKIRAGILITKTPCAMRSAREARLRLVLTDPADSLAVVWNPPVVRDPTAPR